MIKFLSLTAFFTLFLISNSFCSIFTVGQGKTYASPNALFKAGVVNDGDTICIFNGKYIGDDALAVWTKNDLKIIGKEGRPILEADGKYIYGKGIWVVSGNNCTVENIEFTGATVPDQNGAGIRVDGSGIVVRNCYFHHNENGMLITPQTLGDVLVEYSEFAYNGYGDGYSHNIYVNNTNKFTFQFNYSHHAKIGHCVKSRARINTILYNRIMDEEEGNSSRLIDLSNGGKCSIYGNVMHQGPNAENFNAIGIGLEGLTAGIEHNLDFKFNTITNERQASCLFLSINDQITDISVLDNFFGGPCKISDEANSNTNAPTGNVINNSIEDLNFQNALTYDYRLTSASPGIDMASIPVALPDIFQPLFEYAYDSNRKERQKIGIGFDIGAFEYESPNASVEQSNHSVHYKVFPNPASEYLNFVFESTNKFSNYTIYTANATIVQKGIFVNRIDISKLSSGVYFIKTDQLEHAKFVKE
jgi:hypothetical protein